MKPDEDFPQFKFVNWDTPLKENTWFYLRTPFTNNIFGEKLRKLPVSEEKHENILVMGQIRVLKWEAKNENGEYRAVGDKSPITILKN